MPLRALIDQDLVLRSEAAPWRETVDYIEHLAKRIAAPCGTSSHSSRERFGTREGGNRHRRELRSRVWEPFVHGARADRSDPSRRRRQRLGHPPRSSKSRAWPHNSGRGFRARSSSSHSQGKNASSGISVLRRAPRGADRRHSGDAESRYGWTCPRVRRCERSRGVSIDGGDLKAAEQASGNALTVARQGPGSGRSDDYNFLSHRIPAINFFTGFSRRLPSAD